MDIVGASRFASEERRRLRCPATQTTRRSRARKEGARAFAIGTFQAIRNPAHYLTGDGNLVTAFHHLVALSQVAHWFRSWNIAQYVPPLPDLSATQNAQANSVRAQAPRRRRWLKRRAGRPCRGRPSNPVKDSPSLAPVARAGSRYPGRLVGAECQQVPAHRAPQRRPRSCDRPLTSLGGP